MPPKAGRGRRKKLAERSPEGSRSPQQSQESLQYSPSPPLPRNRHPESSDDEDESASPALPAGKSKSKPKVGKGDKGKGKAQKENPPPGASYSFTEAQEEAIARWVENHSILKWYHTQRTQFLKLREGQPKKKSQKRSGDGLSSGYEEDPILAEEASENDSDRDKFIRRVFGFLKPHIRRHKKDTPASLSSGTAGKRCTSFGAEKALDELKKPKQFLLSPAEDISMVTSRQTE
ncbi:hypothetical protein NQZ68_022201 [Dissostichus eleginoides]|nr:hypothetical protein NQZ68_022201 [Dissostichus eleginoides]